ncbi:33965_t:CDS:2 [Gigaspora margarita]|uniref:33965_t:CDS:1 n=1 Tax=Gigaspora margarita TaxID=4874 RepID=A0ABN7U8Y3_GIGMA|nr:33965_t:CDS:2 [Gigaspora margarita]
MSIQEEWNEELDHFSYADFTDLRKIDNAVWKDGNIIVALKSLKENKSFNMIIKEVGIVKNYHFVL